MVGFPFAAEPSGKRMPLFQGAAWELAIWEFPKIRGTLFGGPYNKDPTI